MGTLRQQHKFLCHDVPEACQGPRLRSGSPSGGRKYLIKDRKSQANTTIVDLNDSKRDLAINLVIYRELYPITRLFASRGRPALDGNWPLLPSSSCNPYQQKCASLVPFFNTQRSRWAAASDRKEGMTGGQLAMIGGHYQWEAE